MAQVSISEAARLSGISRSNFYKNYIKHGKLTVTQDHQGRPQIDTAEILRVFGVLNGQDKTVLQSTESDSGNVAEKTEVTVHGNDIVSVLLQQLKETKQEAAEREQWYRQKFEDQSRQITDLTSAVKLLEHQRPAPFWQKWFR